MEVKQLLLKIKRGITKVLYCILLMIFFFPLIISTSFSHVTPQSDSYQENSFTIRTTSNLIQITTPFLITNDGNFSDYGFDGNGTEEGPYLIQGYNITTESNTGISINDTTKYFIIKDCYIEAKTVGIYLARIASGTAKILNNTLSGNKDYAISLHQADASLIEKNTVIDNGLIGIYLSSSYYSIIRSNSVINRSSRGIWLHGCDFSTILNNKVMNSRGSYGIILEYSSSSIIENNSLINDGFYIYEEQLDSYFTYTFKSNRVNNKPLGFFINQSEKTISGDYGQLILINCTQVVIRDLTISNADSALILLYCTQCQLINNSFTNNAILGVVFLYACRATFISENNVTNNLGAGFYFLYCGTMTIFNNELKNNGLVAIYIRFSFSQNQDISLISHNIITDNINGLFVERYYSPCIISYNLFQDNEEYAISLYLNANNNSIHHNNFIGNNPNGSSQVCDNCDNTWYNSTTLEGNYWSDWNGEGNYSIVGSAYAVDPYPFLTPINLFENLTTQPSPTTTEEEISKETETLLSTTSTSSQLIPGFFIVISIICLFLLQWHKQSDK